MHEGYIRTAPACPCLFGLSGCSPTAPLLTAPLATPSPLPLPCPALPQWEALWKNLQKWGRGLARAGLDFGGETQMAELQDISEHRCLPAGLPASWPGLPARRPCLLTCRVLALYFLLCVAHPGRAS